MNPEIEKFIAENSVCSDFIFRNWKEFLNILFENGGCVESILWFEYTPVEKQAESLGGGGFADRDNPEYMWAETMIYDKNLSGKTLSEIVSHIEKVISENRPHNLVPSFFITE